MTTVRDPLRGPLLVTSLTMYTGVLKASRAEDLVNRYQDFTKLGLLSHLVRRLAPWRGAEQGQVLWQIYGGSHTSSVPPALTTPGRFVLVRAGVSGSSCVQLV